MRSAIWLAVAALGALAAVGHTARAEPNPAPTARLRFQIAELGPLQPWNLQIANDGDSPVLLTADPRLLWFEVEVPGRKKPEQCRLPAGIYPDHERRRTQLVLAPGDAVSHVFDPRWYCFAADGQWRLVAGAIVRPHFGWPEKTKTRWKRGKKVTEKVAQKPPFVAHVIEAAPEGESALPDESGPDEKAEGVAVKELLAEPFSLGSAYAAWSRSRLDPTEDDVERMPFALKLTAGSDAEAERTATVGISVRNRSKRTQNLYLRRELISFEVVGPRGPVTCDPEPDQRAPDRQAFYRMTPGRTVTFSSRLVELCPRGTFAQPGLYLVHARLDANESGDDFDLEAFVGRIVSQTPVTVRIRTGEEPGMNRVRRMRLAQAAEQP